MPSDQMTVVPAASIGSPPIVVIRDRSETGNLPSRARQALASADVVFYDEGAAPEALTLVGRNALVEPISAGETSAHARSVARALKLANDGWRVAWIASAQTPKLPPRFIAADAALAAEPADLAAVERRLLATAFNGLAG